MALMRALRPDGVVSVPLDTTIVRVTLHGVIWQAAPALALVVFYPPNPSCVAMGQQLVPLAPYSYTILLAAPLLIASRDGDLQKVVEASLSAKTKDEGVARVHEAMELFRNLPRVRSEVLAASTGYAVEIYSAYWEVSQWLMQPRPEPKTVTACEQTLLLLP